MDHAAPDGTVCRSDRWNDFGTRGSGQRLAVRRSGCRGWCSRQRGLGDEAASEFHHAARHLETRGVGFAGYPGPRIICPGLG